MSVQNRLPAMADMAPDAGHETRQDEDDFAVYTQTCALWADTWAEGDLEFGPDDLAGPEGLGGYGPAGAHTAGEWLLLGERMAADWADAFAQMHTPVRQVA
jgi:hypothetical protein